MKKTFFVIINLFLLLTLMSCGITKVSISMYLWDKSMEKELTLWLEEEFPEIDFTFVVGYNSIDYYDDLNKRNDLPDIITCRRFSLNDASNLSDYLLDLSETNVVGSFYSDYIEANRETNGAIRWLPMCAEVDGYIANADLFNAYNISIPTNYQEFKNVCLKFEELGIKGYLNDYREDYSCMEALQGNAIPLLKSMEGVIWRREYETNKKDEEVGLDKAVWPLVFEKFDNYLKDTLVSATDDDLHLGITKPMFVNGEAAIIRGTASDCANLRKIDNMNAIMLPYFGETSDDNWLLTYPTCQVAVNKSIENDKKKTDVVMQILNKMFSEEGQKKVSASNAGLSYNKGFNYELDEVFDNVLDCINNNHLYIRLASTSFFATSKTVVQKMIRGEYESSYDAYLEFDELLKKRNNIDNEIVTNQETAYSYHIGKNGSEAASALANTIRKEKECDILIGYSNFVSSSIYQGSYNETQLGWLVSNRVLMREGKLTGQEIYEIMEWLINENDGSNPIRHSNLIPVTSGMEYQIKKNKSGAYQLIKLTINGYELEKENIYSVVMLGDNNFIIANYYGNCPMPEFLNEKMVLVKDKMSTILCMALDGQQQFEKPSKYVYFK